MRQDYKTHNCKTNTMKRLKDINYDAILKNIEIS